MKPQAIKKPAMAAAIARLSDGDLGRVAFVYDGRERSILWVVGSLAVDHSRGHRESIAATIG